MITDRRDRERAVRNDLRPLWLSDKRIRDAANKRGPNARRLMDVIDELKSLGFDHTTSLGLDQLRDKMEQLQADGLWPRLEGLFRTLVMLQIMQQEKDPVREFHRRFLPFWEKAVATLHDSAKFSLEDQKYWYWLNLRTLDEHGEHRAPITGAARLSHVLVDEFQDINPLDLALVKAIVDRHQAELTIVGDDDQAIFEWRGATPKYILNPERYFGAEFESLTLDVNYRSPANIVTYSQNLIRNNRLRVDKTVRSLPTASDAKVDVISTSSIRQRPPTCL